MGKVEFYGWVKGMRKISLNELIRDNTDLGVRESKGIVDGLLDGETFVIDIPDETDIEQFVKKARELGALGRDVSS